MQSECQILWDKCLEIIKDNLPEELFTTWFLPIRPYSFNEKKEFRILVPSNFFGEYIEAHFQKLLIPVVQRVMGPDVSLIYRVATYGDIKDEGAMMDCRPEIQARPTPIRQNAPTEFEQKRRIQDWNSYLNPKYSFENYFEGTSNKVVRSASEAIAQNIRNNLLTWKGEFPLDTSHGTEWPRVVGQPTNEGMGEADDVIRTSVFQEPYVREITSLIPELDGRNIGVELQANLYDGSTVRMEVKEDG